MQSSYEQDATEQRQQQVQQVQQPQQHAEHTQRPQLSNHRKRNARSLFQTSQRRFQTAGCRNTILMKELRKKAGRPDVNLMLGREPFPEVPTFKDPL